MNRAQCNCNNSILEMSTNRISFVVLGNKDLFLSCSCEGVNTC